MYLLVQPWGSRSAALVLLVVSGYIFSPLVGLKLGYTDGATTGKAAFDQFVHRRATIDSPFWLDTFLLYVRYPPYTVSHRASLFTERSDRKVQKRNNAMLNMFMHPKPPA